MNYSGKRIVNIRKSISKLKGLDYFHAIDRFEIMLARVMILDNKEKLITMFHSLYLDCIPVEEMRDKLLVVFDSHLDRWSINDYNFFAGKLLGQMVNKIEDLPRKIEISETVDKDVLLIELDKFCKTMYSKSIKSNLKLFEC